MSEENSRRRPKGEVDTSSAGGLRPVVMDESGSAPAASVAPDARRRGSSSSTLAGAYTNMAEGAGRSGKRKLVPSTRTWDKN